jgi:hypothetical protein
MLMIQHIAELLSAAGEAFHRPLTVDLMLSWQALKQAARPFEVPCEFSTQVQTAPKPSSAINGYVDALCDDLCGVAVEIGPGFEPDEGV